MTKKEDFSEDPDFNWKRMYWSVLGFNALLVVLFYFFTKLSA